MMRRQHGFSLIELLISMVIGLVVIGAMMAAYLGTGASSRNTRALAQITEDASVALNVLRTTIGMTGYGTPTGINPGDGMFTFSYPGATLRGCDSDFSDHDLDIGALTCGGDATSDAIAVAYEADAANSVVNADNEPLDCLGNKFDKDASGIWLAYQQFYVSGGSLTCRGPGNAAGQALVDNIETLQIRYGVGDRSVSRANQVVRYEEAATMSADDFKDAVSVRVCVLVRSEDQVMDSATAYRDCDGEEQEPEADDRRMYRAFTSTIVLQNRLKGMR